MLGHYFRLRASNTQNQNIVVTLKARYWKFDSSGAVVYSSEQTLLSAVSVSATSGTQVSSDINNSSDLYVGAEFTLTCTAASTTNGTGAVLITLERSTDAGTTWPTAGFGEPVGGYTVSAADTTSARSANLAVD